MLTPILVIAIAVAAFVLSAAVTRAMRSYAIDRSLLDVPNERSSHAVPTPRGGGVGIVLVVCLLIPALWVSHLLELRTAVALTLAAGIAVLGWADDRRGLSARVRFMVQLLLASLTVILLGGADRIGFGAFDVPLGAAAGSALAILGLVWLTNLYNFMDGIDGIAGSEAVTAGVTGATILFFARQPGLALVLVGVAAAAAGFLVWNWPPARIFMGDVGSAFIGFTFGAVAIGAQHKGVPLAVMLLPLGVFICDATYTLIRRMSRGESLHVAHRSHVYQRLVQRGWTHRAVTALVLTINVALGLLAYVAWRLPRYGVLVLFASILLLAGAAAFALREREPSSSRVVARLR